MRRAEADARFVSRHRFLESDGLEDQDVHSPTAAADAARDVLKTKLSQIDQSINRTYREIRDVTAELAERHHESAG